MKAHVTIRLKSAVLDPQGKAIEHALAALGFTDIDNVRQGKVIEFDLPGQDDHDAAREKVAAMCEGLLANPVIEDYDIQLTD